jgi:hypothetical protein
MERAKVDKQARYIEAQLQKFTELPHSAERVRRAKHIAEQATLMESYAVYEARAHEMSWAAIGEIYGYTRQGAQQRFGGA